MQTHKITRRDFLKILGAGGLAAPFSGLVQQIGSRHTPSSDPNKPNFIILLFDTLTARHMSLYGYERNTTPNIADFARKSTVFHRHHAASSHTRPNTGTLLTGTYPWSHRTLNYYSTPLAFYDKANLFSELSSSLYTKAYTHNTFVTTILDQFNSDINELVPTGDLALRNPDKILSLFKNDFPLGYYASKQWRDNYLGRSYSLFLNPITLLLQILSEGRVQEAYESLYPMGLSDNEEGYLFKLEDAIDYIAQGAQATPTPFIEYFHLLPPHEAYRPRADFLYTFSNDTIRLIEKPPHLFTDNLTQAELEEFSQRYDEYIAFVDSEFGRLYRSLEQNDALRNTYLILTSDHGQLFERGIHGHGTRTLYESLIHIPLIIRSPGQDQALEIHSTTSNVDILPTIVNLADQKVPDWSDGKVLPSFGESDDQERVIFSMDGKENAKTKPLTRATFSAIAWPYKLIRYRGYPGYNDMDELYDLNSDPEELVDLAAIKPSTVSDLNDLLIKNQIAAEQRSIGESIAEDAD